MKIKSFVLLVFFVINIFAIPSYAEVEAVIPDEFGEAMEFVQMLGIADFSDSEKADAADPQRVVSRAEFASMIVKMTNQPPTTAENTAFSDVDFYGDYGSAVYTALNLGIVSASYDGLFNPDAPITYETAAKMAVSALGYDKLAKAKGGYPTGYLAVANNLDILSGTDGEFTLCDAVMLISNSLRADVWVVDAVWDDEIVYGSQEGRNLLTENFNLSHAEGIATTAGFHSMNRGYDNNDSKIEINGKFYDCNIIGTEKYLGCYIDVWYNDKSEVAALYPDSINHSVTINAHDIEGYADFVLNTYENDKECKYKISKSYSFVKNGRYFEQSDSDFKFDNGSLTLVDSDGDRVYDLVNAKVYTYINVSAISELDKIVYDTDQPDKSLNLGGDAKTEIRLYDYRAKSYSEADFDSIEVGSLLEILKSHDETLMEITVLAKNKIEGVVEEIAEDYIVADGEKYKIDNHFYNVGCTVKIGENARFSLSSDGTIVVKLSTKDDMKYGYYLGFSENNTALDAVPLVKLLTTTNQVEVYELAEKVILDSEMMPNTSAAIRNKLLFSGAPRYQLIKYAVNSKGKLYAIDTALVAIGENIRTDLEGNDTLTQYVSKGSALYKDSGIIAPFGKFAGGAIFSVPEDLILGNVYPDDFFVCRGTSDLSNDDQIVVDMYDYSEHYVPKAAVLYVMQGAAGTVSVPSHTATPYMVEAVTGTLDRDGGPSVKLTLCSENDYLYYNVTASAYEELLALNKIPSKGDIVRVSLDSYGEVNGIARDVIMNSDGTFTINFTDGVRSNVRDIFTYATGTLTSLGSSALTIDLDQYGNSMTFELVNNKMTYSLGRSKAILYSGEREYVRPISVGDAKTEMVHGLGNEDKVVVCASYLGVKALFVYRNN